MRLRILLSCLPLLTLFFGFSCTRENKLPSIISPLDGVGNCLAVFPDHPWEAVHRIDAKLGLQGSYSCIGLTKGDPAERNVRCALLSAEGFVLFEAEQHEDRITIIKALPPFDSIDFAKGLIEDVDLIFFAPQGQPSDFGRIADGALVCRWVEPSGLMKEVMRVNSDLWKISLWNDQRKVKREVWLTKLPTEKIASQIELHASEVQDYTLKMVLVE
jgi:hypothetical protein